MSNEPAPATFGLILCTPNTKVQEAVDAALAAVSTLNLRGERNSASAQRSIYDTTDGRVIVNVPASHMLKALGPVCAVCALTANGEPSEAAEEFAEVIAEHGLTAHVKKNLEPEFPTLTFILIDELPHVAFLMWPQQKPTNAPEVARKP